MQLVHDCKLLILCAGVRVERFSQGHSTGVGCFHHGEIVPINWGTVRFHSVQINIDIKLLKLVIPTIRLLSKKEIRKLIRGVLDG